MLTRGLDIDNLTMYIRDGVKQIQSWDLGDYVDYTGYSSSRTVGETIRTNAGELSWGPEKWQWLPQIRGELAWNHESGSSAVGTIPEPEYETRELTSMIINPPRGTEVRWSHKADGEIEIYVSGETVKKAFDLRESIRHTGIYDYISALSYAYMSSVGHGSCFIDGLSMQDGFVTKRIVTIRTEREEDRKVEMSEELDEFLKGFIIKESIN